MNSTPKDPWRNLKEFTDARIGLGRSGSSLPTRELLAFQLAHAGAKDALHYELDSIEFLHSLRDKLGVEVLSLKSQASNLDIYLKRPDLGRLLSEESVEQLKLIGKKKTFLAITNGLSSLAIKNHTLPFLEIFYKNLFDESILTSPEDLAILFVERGRVAITDSIGSILESELGILLVGERPGLSSPDSLGAYLTYSPRLGLTDDSRNCISNIRPAGLKPELASKRLLYLMKESLQKKISGVNLKDRSISEVTDSSARLTNQYPSEKNLLEDSETKVKRIPKIKLCGLRDPEIAVFSVAESADYLGINLSPVSKRKVSPEQAVLLADTIRKANDTYSKDTKIVLLFFKNDVSEALALTEKIQPDLVQLIYDDPIMKDSWDLFQENFSLLPAYSASQELQDSSLPFPEEEIPIIDTPSSDKGGGTGESFPWGRIKGLKRKYLLAGGLNPENVERGVSELNPWGLDVASGIEDSTGNQSREKIREFIRNAKR
ncbi:MAG: ethanolamine ammonia-lyase subunit EutC [Leptospira sp.]|nr:ethanolamine ammonia-lyase subunit EutC [Leptospira sp.]